MVVMDKVNRFHSIGSNDKGQLGLGSTFEKDGWQEIEALAEREVKMIACGYNHVDFQLYRQSYCRTS